MLLPSRETTSVGPFVEQMTSPAVVLCNSTKVFKKVFKKEDGAGIGGTVDLVRLPSESTSVTLLVEEVTTHVETGPFSASVAVAGRCWN